VSTEQKLEGDRPVAKYRQVNISGAEERQTRKAPFTGSRYCAGVSNLEAGFRPWDSTRRRWGHWFGEPSFCRPSRRLFERSEYWNGCRRREALCVESKSEI